MSEEDTEEFMRLMDDHGLSIDDVCKILNRSDQTVRIWRTKKTRRPIPGDLLRILKLELAARGK